jgi:hypothetical protein
MPRPIRGAVFFALNVNGQEVNSPSLADRAHRFVSNGRGSRTAFVHCESAAPSILAISRKIGRQEMDGHPGGTLSLVEPGGLWNNEADAGEVSR